MLDDAADRGIPITTDGPVGSAVWCYVLAMLGAKIGRNSPGLMQIADHRAKAEALIAAVKPETKPIIFAALAVCVLYLIAMKLTAPKAAKSGLSS